MSNVGSQGALPFVATQKFRLTISILKANDTLALKAPIWKQDTSFKLNFMEK